MQPQDYSYSYNAAQAFASSYAFNSVGRIAQQNSVIMSASTPGLPPDTFRQSHSFTSERFMKPLDGVGKFFKGLGSMISSIGMVSKIVSFFYPPAAAVSTVAEIAEPVLGVLTADITKPKPVVFTTQERYNPWMR